MRALGEKSRLADRTVAVDQEPPSLFGAPPQSATSSLRDWTTPRADHATGRADGCDLHHPRRSRVNRRLVPEADVFIHVFIHAVGPSAMGPRSSDRRRTRVRSEPEATRPQSGTRSVQATASPARQARCDGGCNGALRLLRRSPERTGHRAGPGCRSVRSDRPSRWSDGDSVGAGCRATGQWGNGGQVSKLAGFLSWTAIFPPGGVTSPPGGAIRRGPLPQPVVEVENPFAGVRAAGAKSHTSPSRDRPRAGRV